MFKIVLTLVKDIDLTDDAESFGVKLEQEEINTGGEIEAMGEKRIRC